MNKIKKIFVSLGAFIITSVSKIGGVVSNASNVINKWEKLQPMYEIQQDLYGPPPPTTEEMFLKITKPIILFLLFIIGLTVLLNRKITKKAKLITVLVLSAIGVIVILMINYLKNKV